MTMQVPCKQRLVVLAALLRKFCQPGRPAKLLVFFSCCDAVEYLHRLFDNVYESVEGGALGVVPTVQAAWQPAHRCHSLDISLTFCSCALEAHRHADDIRPGSAALRIHVNGPAYISRVMKQSVFHRDSSKRFSLLMHKAPQGFWDLDAGCAYKHVFLEFSRCKRGSADVH